MGKENVLLFFFLEVDTTPISNDFISSSKHSSDLTHHTQSLECCTGKHEIAILLKYLFEPYPPCWVLVYDGRHQGKKCVFALLSCFKVVQLIWGAETRCMVSV
jgi:hypothetical protein